MKVLFISNFDKSYNEGMRNIAKHYIDDCENKYEYECVASSKIITNILSVVGNRYDIIHIILRSNFKSIVLGSLLRLIVKCNVVVLSVVQPPKKGFLRVISLYNPFSEVYALSDDIVDDLCRLGIRAKKICVGVDFNKFRSRSYKDKEKLCYEYGINPHKMTVLHVGHCSKGRNLEAFLKIDNNIFNKVVVCSDMFCDFNLKRQLLDDGVIIIDKYIHEIELFYTLADTYIFPTIIRDYVIDVPLSVTEALACGTPVIMFDDHQIWSNVPIQNSKAVHIHDSNADITEELINAATHKQKHSFIDKTFTWSNMINRTVSYYQSLCES